MENDDFICTTMEIPHLPEICTYGKWNPPMEIPLCFKSHEITMENDDEWSDLRWFEDTLVGGFNHPEKY